MNTVREAHSAQLRPELSFPDGDAYRDQEQQLGGNDAATTPRVRGADPPFPVRVVPLAPIHASDAARLHLAGQTNTFLAELGPEILTIVYEKLPRTDVGFGFAAVSPPSGEASPLVIGFVSAATSVGRLFLETATTRAVKLIPPMTARFIRRPALIGRTLQTALYPVANANTGVHAEQLQSRAELLSIMVEPHCRGSGVGALLLDALLESCASRRIARLDVTVDAQNSGARRFYERHGFQCQNTFRLYGRNMLLYVREV